MKLFIQLNESKFDSFIKNLWKMINDLKKKLKANKAPIHVCWTVSWNILNFTFNDYTYVYSHSQNLWIKSSTHVSIKNRPFSGRELIKCYLSPGSNCDIYWECLYFYISAELMPVLKYNCHLLIKVYAVTHLAVVINVKPIRNPN